MYLNNEQTNSIITMKRINTILAVAAIAMFVTVGCKKKPKPLSEIVAKVWNAQLVKEGSTTVYTKGAATNIRQGYTNYRLDLSNPQSVTLKEFDGNSFTGQWSVEETAAGNTLTLKNLNPQPTGTNGTVQFNINSASDAELILTRTAASQKTGGTINNYTLVP